MKAVAGQSKLCGCSSFRHLQSGVQDLFDLLTELLQKTQCYFPRVANERSKQEGCEGEWAGAVFAWCVSACQHMALAGAHPHPTGSRAAPQLPSLPGERAWGCVEGSGWGWQSSP